MDKEAIRILIQTIKVLGVKPLDLNTLLSRTYTNKSKNLKEILKNNFAYKLTPIEQVFGNRRKINEANYLSYEALLNKAISKKCFNTKLSSKKLNSTECFELIAQITHLKVIYQFFYSDSKYYKMILILYLYEFRFNIPFEYEKEQSINGDWVGNTEFYLNQMIALSNKLDKFYTLGKYKYLNWFKSCKNCLAKKMVLLIRSSTIKEIQKWKGFTGKLSMSFIKKSLDAADRPLDTYFSHIKET